MHIHELFSLKNEVILVTGGAGKYGAPITEALAEAGGKVITASRSLENGKKTAADFRKNGLDVEALYCDQAVPETVNALKKEIKERFGKLTVLINCAVGRPMKTYTSPLKDWEESMNINATGLFNMTREMGELIASSGGGTIVNICSMMGMFGPDLSNYDGTGWDVPPPDYFFHKGGMLTLTKYLARVLADKKIRVNSISPGGKAAADHNEQFIKNYTKKVPVGRLAVHDDIKGAVVFLASKASGYITGENILMDGGMHC